MPVVEKTSGGRVFIRSLDRRFEIGDQAEVDEETASYLCEERGDFERVDDRAADEESVEQDSGEEAEDVAAPFDPDEFTVSELKEELGEGSQFTLAELEALAEAESDGENRETALGAIKARMDDEEA